MFKVGDLVYRAYNPRSPGKVVEVFDPPITVPRPGTWATPTSMRASIKVKWLSGEETCEEGWRSLNSFTDLIEDHQRRLAGHKAKLPLLRAL